MFCKKTYISLLLCALVPFVSWAQSNEADWIIQLTEQITEETNLCERCTWVSPTISEVVFNNQTYIFLRYSCSTNDGFARMYDLAGNVLGECVLEGSNRDCGFGDNAFTIYTFADNIQPIWNCTSGFDCDFAMANALAPKVPITIDDSRCTEGIKILKVSESFQTFNWAGNELVGNSASVTINEGGTYSVTVTDAAGCSFDGFVEIPDIQQLDISIKGPTQFCRNTEIQLETAVFQSYRWSTGQVAESITVDEAGLYQVTVTNDQNCEGTASFEVTHYETPIIAINTDAQKVVEGNPVTISAVNNTENIPIVAYQWISNDKLNCDTCQTTTYFPSQGNELTLEVMDKNGCTSKVGLTLAIEELSTDVYTPNVFYVNSTTNPTFTLYGGNNIAQIERLDIADRWGNLIFTKNNFRPNQVMEGWNGRRNGEFVPQGVYLYMAVIQFINEETKIVTGDVLVLH